jgi:hypothetical protein
MNVTKTIQALLLSRDPNNNIIASEILKTYPILIQTTFCTSGVPAGAGQSHGYGWFNGAGKGFGVVLVNKFEDYNQGYEYGKVYY